MPYYSAQPLNLRSLGRSIFPLMFVAVFAVLFALVAVVLAVVFALVAVVLAVVLALVAVLAVLGYCLQRPLTI